MMDNAGKVVNAGKVGMLVSVKLFSILKIADGCPDWGITPVRLIKPPIERSAGHWET